MGRPKSRNPRDVSYRLRMSSKEMEELKYFSEKLNIPMSKIIRESLKLYFKTILEGEKDESERR